ncbi:uncharacterized protein JCM10292_002429 [Rhodotorula paludigena]|uniref:uncharacterized protein n=1 Tax=Rhodotorula paludigena TaxID=86838 RepID=UPI003174D654
MPRGDPEAPPLPLVQEADDAALAEEAARHLASVRSAHLTKHRGKHAPQTEVIGESAALTAAVKEEQDEVDDDWFQLPDELKRRTVRLRIGNVPKKAGNRILKTVRRKGRRGAPDIVVEADPDEAFEAEDDHDARPEGTTDPSGSSFFGDTPLHASPNASAESLELPPVARTSSRVSNTSTFRPGFSQLTALPTLSELRTVDSASSSSPSGSVYSPPPADTPTRTLTIDDSFTAGALPRRDTLLSMKNLKRQKHRMHLPGRKHLPGQKKRAAAAAEKQALAAGDVDLDEAVARALKERGILADEDVKVECDVLYEHQRGLVVFGLPRFSSNALFQVDPPQWCDEALRPSPFTPHNYPCPPYWRWRDSEFMVDMGGDKDEEGWSYAIRFRSRYWRGEAITMRSFVRRRRWVRTRVYRPQPLLPSSSAASRYTAPESDASSGAIDVTTGQAGGGAAAACSTDVHDLASACAALPLDDERRATLLSESRSAAAYAVGEVDPRNPFISYRRIKAEAAATLDLSAGRASSHEPVWRAAVREINYCRVGGVMRAHARIDRQRLELFRLWLGARDEKGRRAVAGLGAGGTDRQRAANVRMDAVEGPHKSASEQGGKAIAAAAKVVQSKEKTEVWDAIEGEENKPEPDDVWDVIEARLDDILHMFEYHQTRLLFLQLILSLHPVHDATHRYAGHDAPSTVQRGRLERSLSERLDFYGEVERLAHEYGAQGGWIKEEKDASAVAEGGGGGDEGKARERRKGKKRAP